MNLAKCVNELSQLRRRLVLEGKDTIPVPTSESLEDVAQAISGVRRQAGMSLNGLELAFADCQHLQEIGLSL